MNAPPPTENLDLPMMTRAAAIEPRSLDETARTVEIVWTTGATVRRRRMFDVEIDEELIVTPEAVRLDRLNAGAPVLDTHNAFELKGQIGVVVPGSVRLVNGRGVAKIKLSSRAEVEPVFRDIEAGIIRNVSVGYRVHTYEIEKRDGQPELWRAVDWEPYEVSAVAIGADPGAQVRSDDALTPCTIHQTERSHDMATNTSPASPPAQNRHAAEERRRLGVIDDLAKRHELGDEFVKKHRDGGSTIDQVRAAVLEELARRDNLDAGGHSQVSDPCGDLSVDNPQFRRRAMAEAICQRMIPARAASPEAGAYRGFSLVDMARDDLARRGVLGVNMMNPASVMRRVLETRAYGAMGTHDFIAAIGDAGRMYLDERYRAATPVLKMVAAEMAFRDYRPHTSVRGSAFPELKKVNEHGEITRGTLADSGEEIALARYARTVALTHQLLVNDAVGVFADLMSNAAEAALATEANLMAAAIELNPALRDGQNVFSAAHDNLADPGGAPDETALSAARSAMRQMVGLNKERIAPTPRYLLVPTALETAAEKLVAQIQPTKTSDANVFTSLGVLVEPRLDDADAWYLAADPAEAPCLRYGYLDGESGPVVDERPGWEIDGVEVRVRFSFGAGWSDFRGWQKNAGQ